MTHIDEGRLLAFADDELPVDQRRWVERHLEECGACRSGLAEVRSDADLFSAAVGLLDRPAAETRQRALSPPPRRIGGWGRARRALPRAAVLVLAFAAAASATLPGSPVRRWIGALAEPERGSEVAAAAPAAAEALPVEAVPEAGVSVQPLEGRVRVVLRNASAELRVRALLTEGERAWVYASGDAASARFQTGPGRIEVEGAGRGELRVELPRGARNATVIVDGEEYLRKEGEQLQLSVGAERRAAPEVSFRVRP